MLIRIATIAALIASPVLADTNGLGGGGTSGKLNLIVPPCWQSGGGCMMPSVAIPDKTKCASGWVLVQVGSASGSVANKCAAVGDLRDPY